MVIDQIAAVQIVSADRGDVLLQRASDQTARAEPKLLTSRVSSRGRKAGDHMARQHQVIDHGVALRTGHHRLPDGSLVRVDIELGRWVGTLYTPEMKVKAQIVGSDAEVHAWADKIAA